MTYVENNCGVIQGRRLAYCQSCEWVCVVGFNSFGVVISYEEIPDDLKDIAKQRRLNKPGSDLSVFGGCPSCNKTGWPQLEKREFRGMV